MQSYEIVRTVRWVWMQFAMYTYWNHTSQSHRMGMEPIHERHHTQKCISCRANALCEHFDKHTYNPFHFHKIAVANKKTAPYEPALKHFI